MCRAGDARQCGRGATSLPYWASIAVRCQRLSRALSRRSDDSATSHGRSIAIVTTATNASTTRPTTGRGLLALAGA